jgi:hypothetical protein
VRSAVNFLMLRTQRYDLILQKWTFAW